MVMAAPVPFALEHVLDAVVDACVHELTAARRELAVVRAATAAERRDLEAECQRLRSEVECAQSDGQAAAENVLALRRRVTELERELTKACKMGSGSARREADPSVAQRAPAPSVHLSPPRIAVEKGEVIASNEDETSEPAPHRSLPARDFAALPSEDLTDERVGSYACEGRTGVSRADGRALWRFRCVHCKASKDYTVNDIRRIRKHNPDTTCACQKPGGKPPSRAVVDRTGLKLGLFTCEGSNGAEAGADRRWNFRCRTCKTRIALKPGDVSRYVSDGKTPRCTTCEPSRHPGRPRKQQAPERATEREDERPLELDFSELDAIDGGRGDADLDGLLEQSMRDAEGDGRLRAISMFGEREDDEEREGTDDDDDQAEAADG